MPTFTRQELYDLVWSEPMRTLAVRFGLSDVGLKKRIASVDVPAPERGYWARRQAGKAVQRTPLGARGPAMPDTLVLGAEARSAWPYDPQAELDEPQPKEPVFEEPIEALRERVARRVGKVAMVRTLEDPHPAVRAYLDADDNRRQYRRSASWRASLDPPLFESGVEQRRLRLINSLFLGLARSGARPMIQGPTARDLSVGVAAASSAFVWITRRPRRTVTADGPSGRARRMCFS